MNFRTTDSEFYVRCADIRRPAFRQNFMKPLFYAAESRFFRRHHKKEEKKMKDTEMLSAMSDLLDKKLGGLEGQMERLEDRMGGLEGRMERLEDRMGGLEDRMGGLEEQVGGLKDRVNGLEERVIGLEEQVGGLQKDMQYVKVVQLENNVIPRLDTIEGCYVDTSKRYLERTDQIDGMAADIVVLKDVVSRHSATLQSLEG